MFATSFWQRFALVSVCLLLLVLSLPLTIPTDTAFAQSSTVLLNPNQGPAGTQVIGAGANWAGGDQIQVSWGDDSSVLTNTSVQSNGTFTASFEIPTNAGQGGHDIYFTDLTSRYFIPTLFTVNSSPPPTIDLQTINIYSLQPILAGSNSTFRATIRNNGSASSGNFNIRWIADNNTTFDGGHDSIAPGESSTHDHIWNQRGMGNLTSGQHTLTFIANFGHSITETNYNNNQYTFTFTVASPTPRHKLFVFVQGFTSSLTPKDIQKNHGYGDPKDFSDIKASLSHEDPTATFLMYSYHGFTDDGKPEPYPCGLTIANDLADAAVGLRSQISQYLLTHSNTDVYVIGHSEGGVVAFSFLTHMAEGKLSLPNKGILKGVFLLDAPIGGVTDNFLYGQFAKAVAARNPGCGRLTDLPAVKDLVRLYTSATLPNFRGATASIDQKIVMLGNKINQTVAIDAMQQGIVVATIGNSNDKMWRPKDVCAVLGGNFPTTQWLYEVRSGRNAQGGAVYSRSFKSGPEIPCSIPTMAKYMLNHADVLKDKNVLLAIWQMVSGGAPKALPARL